MINKEVELYKKNPMEDNRIPKIMEGAPLKFLGNKYKDIILEWAPKIIKTLDENDGIKAYTTHTHNGEIVRSRLNDTDMINELIQYFEKEFGYLCNEVLVVKNWVTSIPDHTTGWMGEGVHYGGNRFHPDRFNVGSFKLVAYLTDTTDNSGAFRFLAPYQDWFFGFDEIIGTEKQGTVATHIDEDAKDAQILTISGTAGSSFLFSTGLAHKGDYARSSPRYALILGFNYLKVETLATINDNRYGKVEEK
jgi:hypothetical protein